MLYYLASPYSLIENKDQHMQDVMRFALCYMKDNPNVHVVSPLFYHYGLNLVPEVGSDYAFWKNFCLDLLRRCDGLIVHRDPDGLWKMSTGLMDEMRIARELGLRIVETYT